MNGNGEEMQTSSALAANGQQECEGTDTLRVLCLFPSRSLFGFLSVQGIVFPSADSQTVRHKKQNLTKIMEKTKRKGRFICVSSKKEHHHTRIRVVSNAGGVNPLSCAEAIQEVIRKASLNLKVAVVTGDDLMPHRSSLSDVKMADGSSRQKLPKSLHSMNAYLGALPIKRCLDLGADIVVTGRCVDSAVTLTPLMHTFGWERSEYDLLAAGSLAGHLIECGAQSTGGVFTDWYKVPDL
ncbi:hypothetical protein CgunFtcFv8_006000 [Champsocephalus gunnari]|uniref:Acyclic terpene utilisation N-terminal domain-containing protein n=1 Tax=Champsocephalus gunnari TaxID=52237 RepID=A0AAN8GYV4_CHAGU|nr:hypothetical protein CgunFtcFv8_006000 [Champsocephalus gunnari]